ncbi:hypothetical protein PILCRDRAFT_908 [Piloderma croceum F 1598]|uniref:Uncharacterized protein n=1 Tax=Piloderma croceum (strain F 1598) TaxID=765440 RepID=A0A0C3CQ49_PILCF|nr:hypothetical protein PILCRDRAFT_908 [Piloderma croceum F 1598]
MASEDAYNLENAARPAKSKGKALKVELPAPSDSDGNTVSSIKPNSDAVKNKGKARKMYSPVCSDSGGAAGAITMDPIGKLNRRRTPSDWEDLSDNGSKPVIVSGRPGGSGSGAGYSDSKNCFNV